MKADQNGSPLPANAINAAVSLRDGIGPRSERSVLIRSDPLNPFFRAFEVPREDARHQSDAPFMSFVPFMLFLFRLLENVMSTES
jgi:hypothetical protein